MSSNELYPISESWEWTKIGEISHKPQYGWTTKATQKGDLHLLRTTDITSGKIEWDTVPYCTDNPPDVNKYLLEDGDIVISRAGSVGYSYLIKNPRRAVFASYLIRFKPLINEKFFHLFLQTSYYWNIISETKLGIAVPNVNATKLSQINIPIPPINEQVRIVSKIEELFSRLDPGVKALQQTQQQLEQFRQSLLHNAFKGNIGIKKIDNSINREHLKLKIKQSHKEIIRLRKDTRKRTYGDLDDIRHEILHDIPDNWAWANLEAVVFVIDYRGKTPPFSENGIPNIRSSNIRNENITWDDMKFITEKTYDEWMQRGLPEFGDILFTTEAPMGEIAFVPDYKYSIAQRVILLRPNKDIINSKFLFYQLLSPSFKDRLLGKGTGTTVTGVSYRNFRNIELVIPPLKEQKQIADYLEKSISRIKYIRKNIVENILKNQFLKSTILKRAFEGRLISQDPNDEPADILLKKIKAEKNKVTPIIKIVRRRKGQKGLVFKLTPVRKRASNERSKGFG